jgi:hypothetical protein
MLYSIFFLNFPCAHFIFYFWMLRGTFGSLPDCFSIVCRKIFSLTFRPVIDQTIRLGAHRNWSHDQRPSLWFFPFCTFYSCLFFCRRCRSVSGYNRLSDVPQSLSRRHKQMIRNKSPWCLFLSSFFTNNKTLKKRREKKTNTSLQL